MTGKEPRREVVSRPTVRTTSGSALHPVLELAENTTLGDVYLDSMMRTQLALAIRVLTMFLCLFCSLPLVFAVNPTIGNWNVAGLPLVWVFAGVLPFPVICLLGWVYVRRADRNEDEFIEITAERLYSPFSTSAAER